MTGLEKWRHNCAGIVAESWLQSHVVAQDDEHTYYAPCLLCAAGHHMSRRRGVPEAVVICHITERFMVVRPDIDVLRIIDEEESRFMQLLTNWNGRLPDMLSAEDAFRLRTEQGVPVEMLEDRVTDLSAFRAMLSQHSARSGSGASFRREVFA